MTYRTRWLHAALGLALAALPAIAHADPPPPPRARTAATRRAPAAAELMNPRTNGTAAAAREAGVVRPATSRPASGGGPVMPSAETILGDSTAPPTTDCTRVAQGGRRAVRRGARPVAWNTTPAARARDNGLEHHYCGRGATWRQQRMNDSQARHSGRQDQIQDTVRLPMLRVRNR